jgi:hypothetical protein
MFCAQNSCVNKVNIYILKQYIFNLIKRSYITKSIYTTHSVHNRLPWDVPYIYYIVLSKLTVSFTYYHCVFNTLDSICRTIHYSVYIKSTFLFICLSHIQCVIEII